VLSGDIFTINPATGSQLAHLGTTGLDFVGDLDFRPVPEPLSGPVVGFGLLAILSLSHAGLGDSYRRPQNGTLLPRSVPHSEQGFLGDSIRLGCVDPRDRVQRLGAR
jgi:hypothetical protein